MKKQKVILTILIVILVGITTYTINKNDLTFIERVVKDSGTYMIKIVNIPINSFKNKIKENKEKNKMYSEYKKIKKKSDKSDLYYEEIKELKKEQKELKEILNLNNTLSEYDCINSTVINRNIGYFYNNLNIDKGSKNGIKKGDAVIVSKGLIGRIEKVSNYTSTVKLLTTNKISNKISIKIENGENYQYGLLIGYDEVKNVYKIEGITEPNKLKKDDIVTTTGLTDYFPGGIIIGKVKKIVKDEYDLNSIVEVTPTVNYNNISIVTVLNRKAT